jgi:glutamate---cysteine ligase / carboxylate-amine ligase
MYYPTLNIGIEEAYQLIDPQSRELLGYVTQSMSQDQLVVRERTPDVELAQPFDEAVIEVGTPVCADIKEAREKLLQMRESILQVAHGNGYRVMASGTHPFSRWERREVLPGYRAVLDDMQMIARRLLGFGLRVHIGVEDRELAVDVMNTMRYLLPHILCLSTSSPFWAGRNTGLKSYRSVLVDALPRTGIPGYFSSYQEYRTYMDMLVRTKCVPDARQVRYDIMPHSRFSTLVIRICDMMPSTQDTLAVTALIQACVAWMVDLRQRNLSFRHYERLLIAENKWRAVRYGLEGKLLDFGIEEALPAPDLIRELLARVEPYAPSLDSEDELAHAYTMLERGSSADQQLQVAQAHEQDLAAVTDFLIAETENLV